MKRFRYGPTGPQQKYTQCGIPSLTYAEAEATSGMGMSESFCRPYSMLLSASITFIHGAASRRNARAFL